MQARIQSGKIVVEGNPLEMFSFIGYFKETDDIDNKINKKNYLSTDELIQKVLASKPRKRISHNKAKKFEKAIRLIKLGGSVGKSLEISGVLKQGFYYKQFYKWCKEHGHTKLVKQRKRFRCTKEFKKQFKRFL